MFRQNRLIGLLSLLLLASHAWAQIPATHKPVQHVLKNGKVRIFYYTEGQHVVDLTDRNQNRIPDQVEDALTQILAAQMLFIDGLGFPDPFKSKRFHEARFLDIHFRNKDSLKNKNGVAYDELQRYKRTGDPRGTLSLGISIATSVKATSNLTPAHEFFHIIQYSTTFFKNRWFTEGTARWSQLGLGAGGLGKNHKLDAWPLPPEKSQSLFAMTYDASENFWNPLAARVDASGIIPDSPKTQRLKAMTYVDGTKVLKDVQFVGWRFMRNVLAQLDKADDVAFRELGYTSWSEQNQTSRKNDPYILETVMQAEKYPHVDKPPLKTR